MAGLSSEVATLFQSVVLQGVPSLWLFDGRPRARFLRRWNVTNVWLWIAAVLYAGCPLI
jgi:hypothetical protein